ncbi:MAG: formate dehydrogenase accessory protein FdhE [Candidatus Korobacteraceae bacterium]
MSTAWSQDRKSWENRIDRCTELRTSSPWATQVLTFYCRVLQYQRSLSEKFGTQRELTNATATGLRDRLDLRQAAMSLPVLVEIVAEAGPPALAQMAGSLRGHSFDQTQGMLQQWLEAPDASDSGSTFFARVLLQPQAEQIARATQIAEYSSGEKLCPACSSRPQLAVIRPEGDGGKRSLLCSFCMSEWEFRRVLCPACGEGNHEKLPRYSAEGIVAVRVEACDTCNHYLKSVDLTVDGHAVPLVDEIATAPLDLWAAERDYRKIQLNIVGF